MIDIYETHNNSICITSNGDNITIPDSSLKYVIQVLSDINRKKDSSLKDFLPPFMLSPMFQSGWRKKSTRFQNDGLQKIFSKTSK